MPKLITIVASTRPGRIGEPVADWFVARAERHGGFDVEVADLAEINLPLLDEPHHPMLREYTMPHTHEWSRLVDAGDAYALVMPEYNHSFTAPLKNALDFLNHEWRYKPAGFVSYGGVAAGTRAVQALKPVLVGLRMTPVLEAVNIPFVASMRSEDGERIEANDLMNTAADAMLDELAKIESALRPLREEVRASA